MPPPRVERLPRPGDLLLRDFRGSDTVDFSPARPIRILQWNIERGYELEGIIKELQGIDADILALQEIDIGCARSNWEDTGERIAQALQLNYAFVCEFEEIYSAARSKRSQGGGVHGNAILTKFDMTDVCAIDHRYQPVDWEDASNTLTTFEPRNGRRLSLVANVVCPKGPMAVFSSHLEVFTGITGRLEQFSELFNVSKERISQGVHCQAILGDLNTLGHSIARMSPHHCTDALRWKSLGQYEAEFWIDNVFSVQDPMYPLNRACQSKASSSGKNDADSKKQLGEGEYWGLSCLPFALSCMGGTRQILKEDTGLDSLSSGGTEPSAGSLDQHPDITFMNGKYNAFVNRKLLDLGLDTEVCRNLLNPGFYDPFDTSVSTLEPDFTKILGCQLMDGKLDWLLVRSMTVQRKQIGNHSYSLSDHKWLAADVCM